MKTILTFPILVMLMLVSTITSAQVKLTNTLPRKSGNIIRRCATMEDINHRMAINPAFRNFIEASRAENLKLLSNPTAKLNNTARVSALTAPVVIPIVVHIVLPNPNIISDQAVDYFINRLNLDYSGLNPDSANGATFLPVRGHSAIRFVLARRDPSGNYTSGIIRKKGTTLIQSSNPQPIKNSATPTGGSTGWDVTQYYNIYVGDADGDLLGISPEIGVGGPAGSDNADGVCVNYRVFSNSCFAYSQFNMARTAVHEIGHNFGLYHTFTDGCADVNDFQQLTTPAQLLPVSLLQPRDDTPKQKEETSGCPSPGALNGCDPAIPKMFQNYLDYTDDACYSMFTKGQVDRMHYVLENFRPGYLTSLGAQYPTGTPALNIAIGEVVSPGGSEFFPATCTLTSYPVPICPGNFIPRVMAFNRGTTAITSVAGSVKVNSGTTVTQTFTVNIPPGKSQVIAFPVQALVEGVNTITFTVSSPNGGVDGNPADNTTSINITIAPPASLPITQNFENGLLPSGWTLFNPDNDNTWVNVTPGTGGIGGAAAIDNFSGTEELLGNIDDLRTLRISNSGLTSTDSVVISFDLAHKQYPGQQDTLDILVSTDCGTTFTRIYRKTDPALATAGSTEDFYSAPLASDWRKERVAIGNNIFGSGPFIVVFRNISGWGNVVWIDNININIKPAKDLAATNILRPAVYECSGSFAPSLTVQNLGIQTITSFKAGYILNNGTPVINTYNITLAPFASTTINFANLAPAAGDNIIKLFVAEPVTGTPGPDGSLTNDTMTRSFSAPAIVANINEGFENAFLPPGWRIINPQNNNTWIQKTPGRNSTYSAFIDNYTDDFTGESDALVTPPVASTIANGLVITFDVAHKNYPGSSDRLRVLASADCGTTFTPIYSKSGAVLATAGSTTNEYINPLPTDWRTEVINVGAPFLGTNVIIAFENTSDFGNNIFLDNIRIGAKGSRDAQLLAATPEFACSLAYNPSVTVKNAGTETITSITVGYVVGNGTPVTRTVTGLNILQDASAIINIGPGNLSAGANVVKFFTANVASANGTGDFNQLNDTLTKTIYVTATLTTVNEGFEGLSFPPAGWALVNRDNGVTWQRASVGLSSSGSAAIRNFINFSTGQKDDLVTPLLSYGIVDSVKLSFDLAANTRTTPGSTTPTDTLEILATRDCGNTFTTVYKKWGTALQTVTTASSLEFVPANASQWRTETIDLSLYRGVGPLQVVFRNTTNNQNSILIDNVNLRTRILPANLKKAGYVIYPNPSSGLFNLWYLRTPTNLRYITVYNVAGRMVWRKVYTNNTINVLPIDLTGQPAGVYVVTADYSEGDPLSVRVLKTN